MGNGKRPDLAGQVLHQAEGDPAYLIDDDGTRRLVPDSATYTNLFGQYVPTVNNDINTIDRGPDISDGAILANDPSTGRWYLIDNRQKRYITSQTVVDKFHFARDQIKSVPDIVLNCIADGPDIT